MSFFSDIEDSLLTTLNSVLTIPVIADAENGPEPSGDYGLVRLAAADKLHRNAVQTYPTDDGMVERVKQDFLVRLTITFYGDSAYDNAFESQAILASRVVQEELFATGNLSYADITSVRRIPERRDTGLIQRASYDIKFLTGFEYIRTIDWFDKVSYSGKYITPAGNLVLATNGTVSTNGTTN